MDLSNKKEKDRKRPGGRGGHSEGELGQVRMDLARYLCLAAVREAERVEWRTGSGRGHHVPHFAH